MEYEVQIALPRQSAKRKAQSALAVGLSTCDMRALCVMYIRRWLLLLRVWVEGGGGGGMYSIGYAHIDTQNFGITDNKRQKTGQYKHK
jgi:hypothetical protein